MREDASLHSARAISIAIAIMLAVHILKSMAGYAPIWTGDLSGPDEYMKLERIVDLHEGSATWYDATQPDSNAPYGERLHWTRAFDLILLAGAYTGSAFTDFETALWWTGSLASPLLGFAAIFALSWASRPFFGDRGFVLASLLFSIQPQSYSVFMPGKSDHHGLLVLLFIVILAGFMRMANEKQDWRIPLLMGFVGGLALWSSVETVTYQIVLLGSVGFLWVIRGRHHLRDLWLYSLGLFATAGIAMMIERPPSEWFSDPSPVRISSMYWYVTMAGLVSMGAAYATTMTTGFGTSAHKADAWRLRLLVAASASAACAGMVWAVFPQFFGGPWGNIEQVVHDWHTTISELQPLWPTDRKSTGMFLAYLLPCLLAVGVLVAELSGRIKPTFRDASWPLLFSISAFGLLSLEQVRWSAYPEAAASIPWVVALSWIAAQGSKVKLLGSGVSMMPFAFLAGSIGHIVAAAAVLPAGQAAAEAEAHAYCPWKPLYAHLNQMPGHRPGEDILFTYLFHGPELLWRTTYKVVGAPYDNPASISDTNDFFKSLADDESGKRIAEERAIDYVLVCGPWRESYLYEDNDDYLHNRLVRQEPPSWLKPVELPDGLGSFRLYRMAP